MNVSTCGSYEVGDVGDHEGRSANVVVGLGVDACGAQVVGDAAVEGFGCFLAAHAADDVGEGSIQACCQVVARSRQTEEDVICSYALLEFREEWCDTCSSGGEYAAAGWGSVRVRASCRRVVEEVPVREFKIHLVAALRVACPRRTMPLGAHVHE